MTWRPTWPELLSLFEELRFQVAVVVLVLAIGAFAVVLTLPRGAAPSSAPAPGAMSDGPASGDAVAGPPPAATSRFETTPTSTATVVSTAIAAATTAIARPSATPLARPPAGAATPGAGDQARLVAPVPVRLACSEERAPLGVLLAGTPVEVIETGTAACEGWLLVQSTDSLTWLRPSAIELAETADAEQVRPAP